MSAPAVAVSTDGNKFAAAWKDVRMGEPNVYWAISDTPRFHQESLVHEETEGKQDHPSLAFDSRGTVWVAWEDNRGGVQRIWVRSSQATDEGRAISDLGELPASYPVVVAGSGLVAVVYESGKRRQKSTQFQLIATVHGY